MRSILLALACVLLAACSPSKLAESMLTPDERSVMRGALDDVAKGDAASLSKKMPAEVAVKIPEAMPVMRQALPPQPFEISVVNANWTSNGSAREAHAVYQVQGRSAWALVEATTATVDNRTQLVSIYVTRTTGSPQQQNSFSLAKAGAGGWIMLGLMFAAVAVTIAALIRIWRSGRFDRRWLWTIGTLIGFTTLSYNWATGAFSFQPISFHLFSISALKSPIYAPWVLTVSIPVVALIALFKQGYDSWEEPGLNLDPEPPAEG